MTIKQLLNLDNGSAIEWLIENQYDFAIVPRVPTKEIRMAFHESMDDFNNGVEDVGSPDDQWKVMIEEWEIMN